MQTPKTHTESGHTSAGYNFDHPDAFDTDAIIACLDDLKVGAAASSLCCAVLCCAVRLIAGYASQRRLGVKAASVRGSGAPLPLFIQATARMRPASPPVLRHAADPIISRHTLWRCLVLLSRLRHGNVLRNSPFFPP